MRTLLIERLAGSFAENKDVAARLRQDKILPAVLNEDEIRLDFTGVSLTTQSFVHALISEALRRKGERALDFMEFAGCNESIRGIIETVVQYVLETVVDDG